jgi:capsular polysaccharide biosynthesis protein
MNNPYSLSDFIAQILKWKKELLIFAVSIFTLSIIGSMLLPNYYKAETTFYAASPDLAKPIPIGGDDKDVRIYGDDKDLDRLFTIASSHEVLFFLIDSFELYEHYDIDKDHPKAKFKVKEEFLENYKTIKTKYGALQLIVEDKDPKTAADIANTARMKIETIAQGVVKSSQKNLIDNYENNLKLKKTQSDTLANRLRKGKASVDLFDTWGQTGMYNKMLSDAESDLEDAKGKISVYKKYPAFRDSVIKYLAIVQGAEGKKIKSLSEMEKYAPILSDLKQMESELSRLYDQISLDKERLKQLSASYNAKFTALHLIEAAEVPVQKSRPKRSIIVVLSSLIGIMFSFLAVLIIDNIKTTDLFNKNR